MTGRVEVRDGQVFQVTVIPEVKRRQRRKGMMTKKAARAIAITGGKPPLPHKEKQECSGCGRISKIVKRPRLPNGHRLRYCGSCTQGWKKNRKLDAAAKAQAERS